MYIEKTKNNKYKYIDTYVDFNGKRKKVSVTLDKNTKQTQTKAYRIIQEKISKKMGLFNLNFKFIDCFQEYIEFKKTQLKPSSFSTFLNYYKMILQNSFNWDMNKISAKHILSILKNEKRDLATKTRILKEFIMWAYKKDYVEDITFLKKIEIPKKITKEVDKLYLEKEELEDVLNFFKGINMLVYHIIIILANTGLRIGELMALKYSDINGSTLTVDKTLYHNMILSPKTKTSKRKIEINSVVINSFHEISKIQKVMNIDGCIFSDINVLTLRYHLKKYKKISLHPHIFRHTHASLLIEKGIPTDMVSRRLGHADSKITQKIYIHLTNKLKEKEDKIFRELII